MNKRDYYFSFFQIKLAIIIIKTDKNVQFNLTGER